MFAIRSETRQQNSFDKFLFASIGREDCSMPISVLSLFSRLDLDPAVEARVLVTLPQPNAAERLAHQICSLPGNTMNEREAREQAKYLILLLPGSAVRTTTKPPPAVTFSMLATAWLCSVVAIMAITFVTQLAGHYVQREPATAVVASDREAHSKPSAATGTVADARDLRAQHR